MVVPLHLICPSPLLCWQMDSRAVLAQTKPGNDGGGMPRDRNPSLLHLVGGPNHSNRDTQTEAFLLATAMHSSAEAFSSLIQCRAGATTF